MTLGLKTIWLKTNRVLTSINMFLVAFILLGGGRVTKIHERKIPVALNIILLFIFGFILFALTYGAYRHANL